ncbi:MAG: Glycerate 3-kinase [Desulfovibrio sp.]|uniref:glycerate kinase n=1 Tax=Christensenella intestinihominis TaxID=1851429 RepID=UPI00082D590D|nr:glycerate kinase [Christensenella intestinihominis]
MKIVIAPDSFKGTITSGEICDIVAKAVMRYFPEADVVKIPVSDGGEGMVDALLEGAGGERVTLEVTGPDFTVERAVYGILPDGTAVIEMAEASGIMLAKIPRRPMDATSRGTGQMIRDAAKRGCRKIILGIGGSATMDAGLGMAAAMGVRFLDGSGGEVEPTARGLGKIARIDASEIPQELHEAEILIASDVKNPACGEMGSAHVFGKQKGASQQDIMEIDGWIGRFCGLVREATGKDLLHTPGTGAAGGMAIPLLAFFGANIVPGIDLVLDAAGFDEKICGANMIITGEGMLDGQSMEGKVPVGVARRAKKEGIPVVALVGDIGPGYARAYGEGITAIFSTNKAAVPFEIAKRTSKEDLALLAESLFSFKAIR